MDKATRMTPATNVIEGGVRVNAVVAKHVRAWHTAERLVPTQAASNHLTKQQQAVSKTETEPF